MDFGEVGCFQNISPSGDTSAISSADFICFSQSAQYHGFAKFSKACLADGGVDHKAAPAASKTPPIVELVPVCDGIIGIPRCAVDWPSDGFTIGLLGTTGAFSPGSGG